MIIVFLFIILKCADSTNCKSSRSSDTKDVESPGMYVLRHVGVFPLLALLIPAHHYQQGGESEGQGEDRNFHLSHIRIVRQGSSPLGVERFTLTSVANRAFWMRMVETTLRIPANRDFLQTIPDHIYSFFHPDSPWERKSCPGNTGDGEDGAVSPESIVDVLVMVWVWQESFLLWRS